jgi:hypothetical protein
VILRIYNHLRDDYQDHNLSPQDVRAFVAKKFPWIDSAQSLQDILEEINDTQVYKAEVLSDVQKTEASPDTSAGVAAAMLGHNANTQQTVAAAFWLAGKQVDEEKFRSALWQEDGDVEKAALRAAGLDVSEELLAALRSLLAIKSDGLHKSGDITENQANVQPPRQVLPGTDTATRVAVAVQRAFKAGDYKLVNLGGKHSSNSAILKDPETGRQYLMKPGSGGVGPAAGVHEEAASQARRESAYSHIAESIFGMGNFVPSSEMLVLDGKEWAAIDMLPLTFKNLDKVKKKDQQRVGRILNTYRQQGLLHRWAVMDYVLGNPDRHAGNLMVSPDDHLKLIDQGSAFAGPSFNPGADKSSFIPYYLRWTVSTENFNQMDPQRQLSHMPVLNEGADQELRQWIHGLEARHLEAELKRFGMRADACLARLELVQSLADDHQAIAPRVNSLWLA